MPRLVILDAHEWINEVLTVSDYIFTKLQTRERASNYISAGQEDPFELHYSLNLQSGDSNVVYREAYATMKHPDIIHCSANLINFVKDIFKWIVWLGRRAC